MTIQPLPQWHKSLAKTALTMPGGDFTTFLNELDLIANETGWPAHEKTCYLWLEKKRFVLEQCKLQLGTMSVKQEVEVISEKYPKAAEIALTGQLYKLLSLHSHRAANFAESLLTLAEHRGKMQLEPENQEHSQLHALALEGHRSLTKELMGEEEGGDPARRIKEESELIHQWITHPSALLKLGETL